MQTSYALALLHLALHDTVAKTGGGFTPYHDLPAAAPSGTDQAQALTGAFIRMGSMLYPAHAIVLQAALTQARADSGATGSYPNTSEAYGESVADALLTRRQNDGTNAPSTYTYGVEPGEHRPDPVQPEQGALGSNWGNVIPFTYGQDAHPAVPAPPKLQSQDYLDAYNEVYKEGREDLHLRKPLQAMVGVFWGYDGSQKLGTPPRLYNQVVRTISDPFNLTLVDEVRLFTLINVGMADAGIACWYHKYKCNFWRPVVAIREAADGAGLKGKGDTVKRTDGDPFWLPLGLPHTNASTHARCTPGFPAYPSGHATFGATCFQLASRFLGKKTGQVKFDFVSDEFNGVNRDDLGVIRPRLKRSLTLASAIQENADSRIYLGVHWKFDATAGINLAGKLIDKIDTKFGKPRRSAAGAGPAAVPAELPPPPAAAQRQQMR